MNYKETMETLRKEGSFTYQFEFTPNIGLHRTVIKDIHIKSLNPDKLSSSGARYITDEKNYALTDDAVPFSSISKVRLKHVNEFKARGYYKPFDDMWTESVTLDSSPTDALMLNSLLDFQMQLVDISDDLLYEFGIDIETDNAKFKSAEIAAEFILKDPLSEYSRAFHILKSLNTQNVTKIDTIKPDDGINSWQSCIYKKSCYELYIYDKTRQLYETQDIVLSENIVKIELRIPDKYLYQTRLKGNIYEITDDDIKELFLSAYKRIIFNPFKRWNKQYIKNLNALVSEYRSR